MSALTADDLEGPDSGLRPPPSEHHRRNVALTIASLAIAVAVLASMVFSGSSSSIQAQVAGFTITGPEEVIIDFTVDKPTDVTVECTLEALAPSYAQIGLTTVTVGPSDSVRQHVSVAIPTTQEATSAVVKSCLRT